MFAGGGAVSDLTRRAPPSPAASAVATSEAPFVLEYAPGLILVSAEIRDKQSLGVFVAAVQALGVFMPEAVEAPVAVAAAVPRASAVSSPST